jgi:circadian clock protein KaiB
MKEKLKLILFVSGMSVRSVFAIENVKTTCKEYLGDDFELEIIDVSQESEKSKAKEYGIFAIPTLLKIEPAPRRMLVGDMSDKEKLIKSLDLK